MPAKPRRAPSSGGVPLSVLLDSSSSEPVFRQLYRAIRNAVLTGRLKPGVKLPSTRVLAAELDIARSTATLAYEYLHAEGYVTASIGSGTYVSRHLHAGNESRGRAGVQRPNAMPALARVSRLACRLADDAFVAPATPGSARPFRVGEPGLDAFPTRVWARLLHRHARRNNAELLAYGDARGYSLLRRAILEHIAASRGVRAELSQVFLVRGTQQAIDLIVRALLDPGDSVWVEDPGYLMTRSILSVHGLQLEPVPVDQHGLIVDEGIRRSAPARAAFVAPSNQFPLGVRLSLPRRLALIEWALQQQAWIIEDDYDSEFQYESRPIPCMQGLDRHGVVLYVGTFSKTMFPALRLGYLVVPQTLVPVFERARDRFDSMTPSVEQAALADFIAEGEFSRHVRRMRELYRDRQAFLIVEAQRLLADWLDVQPVSVGMQMIATLRPGVSECEVVEAGSKVGVELRPLSLYTIKRQMPPALVLGFPYPETTITAAVQRLAAALRRAR